MLSTKEITLHVNQKRVTLELCARGAFDSNYGADADGNRGVGVWFIEEVTWDMPEKDDDGNKLTDEEKVTLNELLDKKVDQIDF